MDRLYFLDLGSFDREAPDNKTGSVVITDSMFGALPREKRQRILRYRHGLDRKIGICSEVLLRCLVSMELGVKFSGIDIRTGPAGKPYVKGAPGFHFSISHTRSAVAAVLSDEPAGVDVERIREIDLGIAPSVFSEKELSLLVGSPEDRYRVFLDIWTKKEARLKRCGTGLTGDLKACDITARVPGEELSTMRCGAYIVSVGAKTKYVEGGLTQLTEADLADMWRHCANSACFTIGE
jgi:4'-phosphopantetheinyl transferase